jgi:hypothetical protein
VHITLELAQVGTALDSETRQGMSVEGGLASVEEGLAYAEVEHTGWLTFVSVCASSSLPSGSSSSSAARTGVTR